MLSRIGRVGYSQSEGGYSFSLKIHFSTAPLSKGRLIADYFHLAHPEIVITHLISLSMTKIRALVFLLLGFVSIVNATNPWMKAQTCCSGCSYASSCCCKPKRTLTRYITRTVSPSPKTQGTMKARAVGNDIGGQHLCPTCPSKFTPFAKNSKNVKYCCPMDNVATVTSTRYRTIRPTTIKLSVKSSVQSSVKSSVKTTKTTTKSTSKKTTSTPTYEPVPDKEGAIASDVTFGQVQDAVINPLGAPSIVAARTDDFGVIRFLNPVRSRVTFVSTFKTNRTVKAVILERMTYRQPSEPQYAWVLLQNQTKVQPFFTNVDFILVSIVIKPQVGGDSVAITFEIMPNVCANKTNCMMTFPESIADIAPVFAIDLTVQVYSIAVGKRRAEQLNFELLDQTDDFAVGQSIPYGPAPNGDVGVAQKDVTAKQMDNTRWRLSGT